MFIGSSVEGKRIAESIQLALEYEVHSTIWYQGVFGLSGGTLESLVAALEDFDFATLVLTADDLVEKRASSGKAPRDNVLFELGLFMGALGRERSFIVHSRTTPPFMPTDLAGITPATFEERSNLDAALGPVCTKIKRAIEAQGIRSRPSSSAGESSEVVKLHSMLSEQHLMIKELLHRLVVDSDSHAMSAQERATESLDFLAGAWVSHPNNSHAYCTLVEGRPRVVYCYDGNFEATGEYYDFKRIGEHLVSRFRWFNGSNQGFVWFKVEDMDTLRGAWWMDSDVPRQAHKDLTMLPRLQNLPRTNYHVWTRVKDATFPAWATRFLGRVRPGEAR